MHPVPSPGLRGGWRGEGAVPSGGTLWGGGAWSFPESASRPVPPALGVCQGPGGCLSPHSHELGWERLHPRGAGRHKHVRVQDTWVPHRTWQHLGACHRSHLSQLSSGLAPRASVSPTPQSGSSCGQVLTMGLVAEAVLPPSGTGLSRRNIRLPFAACLPLGGPFSMAVSSITRPVLGTAANKPTWNTGQRGITPSGTCLDPPVPP